MPYRHAHLYVLCLFPLAGLAFWPGYLGQFAASPPEFHVHGATASLWLILLIVQSLTIQSGRRPLHRSLGLASLLLFPLFLAGGIGIFIGMAQRFAVQLTPFHTLYAPRLAWLDLVSVAGFAYFFFEGLRRRRQVNAHSGYMLATAIFLLPPILGRLVATLPVFAPTGPEDFGRLSIAFQVANAATAAIAFAIAWRSGRHGRPFWQAGGLTLIAALLFEYPGGALWWHNLYAQFANLPAAPLGLAVAFAGAMIAWGGWIAGRRPVQPSGLAAA